METPSPAYILSRAAFVILLGVAVLFGVSFIKKKKRQEALFNELRSLTSDSKFFQQFYAEDARKSLIRALGIIAEAETTGVPIETSLDRAFGVTKDYFKNEFEERDIPAKERIIRVCLSTNRDNLVKLGYPNDFQTINALKSGELPAISGGPHAGEKPEVAMLIDPAISPGLEKVIANLEIRPPRPKNQKPTDIEVAAAKQLARDLAEAGVIEDAVKERIIAEITKSAAP